MFPEGKSSIRLRYDVVQLGFGGGGFCFYFFMIQFCMLPVSDTDCDYDKKTQDFSQYLTKDLLF
jgi:hypothetical protein